MDTRAARIIRRRAHRLTGREADFTPLLDRVGDAHLVLIGEASHGTHEFYRIRAEITKRLIREKGFAAIAVEGDWPDVSRVDRFVRGRGDDRDATSALGNFRVFPRWMWRNADVLDFIGWLRAFNDARETTHRVGIYGLDLYGLHASIATVLAVLRRVDPPAAIRAAEGYACFDHVAPGVDADGSAAALGLSESCEKAVVDRLVDRCRTSSDAARLGATEREAIFTAEQNARVARGAEEYYRTMVRGGPAAWNLRNRHMADTIDALRTFLTDGATLPKIVVWAHNAHLGDARWTEMSPMHEANVGQLVRAKYDTDAVLVGMTTYAGTVSAASRWNAGVERTRVVPALEGSCEHLLHSSGLGNLLLIPRMDDPADEELNVVLDPPMLQRAIGLVYRPSTERFSHYCLARLARQFDAVLHYDVTRAVEPLDRTAAWELGDMPDTLPTAL